LCCHFRNPHSEQSSITGRPTFLEKSTRSAPQAILGTHPVRCRSDRSRGMCRDQVSERSSPLSISFADAQFGCLASSS
jgi:hypothetical protein